MSEGRSTTKVTRGFAAGKNDVVAMVADELQHDACPLLLAQTSSPRPLLAIFLCTKVMRKSDVAKYMRRCAFGGIITNVTAL